MTADERSGGSPELAAFRQEVRAWLAANADGAGAPVDAGDVTLEQFRVNRAFLRKLGQQGWYAPGWPAELGGGGLPKEKWAVLREEMLRAIPHTENILAKGDVGFVVATGIWLLGTEEQKRTFLPKVLKADAVTWELYTEPEAGSDLPSLRTLAVRDGDSYVLSGTKTFVGGGFEPDQMYVLAVTDAQGARHKNLSMFVVPADSPGITVMDLPMIASCAKRTVVLDNVIVPAGNRIGQEGDGWRAFNAASAGSPMGGVGFGVVPTASTWILRKLIDYARTTPRGGTRIIDQPGPKAAVARIWMDGEVERLMQRRNNALIASRVRLTYQGQQVQLYHKLFGLRLAEAQQRILGPLANISGLEWAPEEGEFEHLNRHAILETHPGGTCEVTKMRLFRGMEAFRPSLGVQGHGE